MRATAILLLFLFVAGINVKAQTDSSDAEDSDPIPWAKPSDEDVSRFGIVMGTQLSTLYGAGVPNNRPKFGLLGGGYGRIRVTPFIWIQQQLQVSFRGSRFNNGTGEISSIRMLSLDAPLLLLFRFKPGSKHKAGAGVQYSTLLSADIYSDNQSFPAGISPGIDRNDWGLLVAWQYQLDYLAFQVAVKTGLRNQNLGRSWPGPNNSFLPNNGRSLNHFGVEFNLVF